MTEQEQPYKVVASGVDTFFVNYKFANEHGILSGESLPDDIIEQLDTWQKEARKEHMPVATDLEFSYTSGGETITQTLFIRSHGEGAWPWLLYADDVKVKFAPGTLNKGLFCQARFSSHLLWTIGPDKAIDRLEETVVSFLGDVFLHKQASEIHLCADVQGFDFSRLTLVGEQLPFVSRVTAIRDRPIPPTEEEQEGGLTAKGIEALQEKIDREIAEEERFHPAALSTAHRRIATIDFGSHASKVSCQIYNKTLEIKKHHKEWMEDIHLVNGWDRKSIIWRIEFRFKRAFLRDFELDEAGSVLARLAHLWTYATQEWLRFVDLDGVTGVNISRRPTHPVWEVIQHAYDGCLQRPTYDEQGVQSVRLAYALETKPLEVLEQAVSILAASTYDHEHTDDDMSREQYEQERQAYIMQEYCSIADSLQDEPKELLQSFASAQVARLTDDQVTFLLDYLVPQPVEETLSALVRRRRRMAKLKSCIAAGTGYLRAAVALMPPDEVPRLLGPGFVGPGVSASRLLPDRVSSFLWFAEKSLFYDEEKGRSHVDEVLKKQVGYGFITAMQLEEERRRSGVDLLPEDLSAIDTALARVRARRAKQNDKGFLSDFDDSIQN
jgi:hypothetical protein